MSAVSTLHPSGVATQQQDTDVAAGVEPRIGIIARLYAQTPRHYRSLSPSAGIGLLIPQDLISG